MPVAPASTDSTIIRCKTCNVPLQDMSWKNCDRCRRNRTESYNRWKKSVQASKSAMNVVAAAGSSLSSQVEIPSTSRLDLNPSLASSITITSAGQRPHDLLHPESFTPSQTTGSTYTIPPAHRPTGSSQPSGSVPQTAPTPAAPARTIHIPEYQMCDELIAELIALPPRSNFVGKFSVIPDPEVDNLSRAHIFENQVRAKGLPISCGYPPPSPFLALLFSHTSDVLSAAAGHPQPRLRTIQWAIHTRLFTPACVRSRAEVDLLSPSTTTTRILTVCSGSVSA
jgi:hypothetical protein